MADAYEYYRDWFRNFRAYCRLRPGAGRAGYVIRIPSLVSPDMAPAGMHAVTIYTICPDRLKEGSWSARKAKVAAVSAR